MLLNFNNKKDIAKLKYISNKIIYDYVIIGSGPAATVLYREILKYKKKKILLIERGNFEKKIVEKVCYNYLPINLRSRIFSVGGTSNEWSSFSSYFEDFELTDRWKKKSTNLWPFSSNYLKKIYNNLDNSYGFNFKKISKKKFNFPFQIRGFIANNNPINFKNLINTNKIDLLINCPVETVSENENISNVNIEDNSIKISGKKIILCAGGLESVKIILKSVKYNKLSLINKKAVGLYFMDHPKINIGFIENQKKNFINKLIIKKQKNLITYHGVSLDKKKQKKNKLLNSYVRFEKVFYDYDKKFDKFNLIKSAKHLIERLFKFSKKNIFRLRLFCEMKPSKSNKIYLSKDDNLIVNYKFSSTDIQTIKELQKQIYVYFSSNFRKERIFPLNKKSLFHFIDDASHHMGGLIYSKNKKESVIDKNLKILGTKNIYICSSAIFPTSGSANPTMTICALAVRLAKYFINQKK